MIFYVTTAVGSFTMRDYLQSFGTALRSRIQVFEYEEFLSRQTLPVGSYVFAAQDQLFPRESQRVRRCWDALSQSGFHLTLLNDPNIGLYRIQLLQKAFEQGGNVFRAARVIDSLASLRYPVFLHHERLHTGSLSPLLHNPWQLRRAILSLWLDGYRLRDLIVIEYCHTASADGLFRKYSAFIVGDQIIPRCVYFGRNWVTKAHGRIANEETTREQSEYLAANPHAEWLRRTFSMAGITYGRIDYGLFVERPQVWEINVNPTICPSRPAPGPLQEEHWRQEEPAREFFFQRFQSAWEAVDSDFDSNPTVEVPITRDEVNALRAEREKRQRIDARRNLVGAIGRPLTAATKPLRAALHLR
jgi:hypothetical protein